jgi:hypothetical protein
MVRAAVASRKIWRRVCRQIFRENSNPSLPVSEQPRGQLSGAVQEAFTPPPELVLAKPESGLAKMPELDPAIEDLIRQVLDRVSVTFEARDLATSVIARLRHLVGDLPASADHHHSEPYGLLRHSLEVALKMLQEFERILGDEAQPGPMSGLCCVPPDSSQWQYLCFLASLGHDLGKLFDMNVTGGERRWSPLHETYSEFLRQIKVEPVLTWRENRVRGAHAQFSPWLMHHLLTAADIEFVGLERLPKLTAALTGTHTGGQSNSAARLLSKVDQESVEQAAPDWMTKQPNSKVNLFIRALRTLVYNGKIKVNCLGAQIYVTGDKAAVVVPISILLAREFLKKENLKLPSNHRMYDLLAQSELVEANEDRQCVQTIKVRGKKSSVELSAVIFDTGTIIPDGIVSTLPNIGFEIKPEEPKQTVATASSMVFSGGFDHQSPASLNEVIPDTAGNPLP